MQKVRNSATTKSAFTLVETLVSLLLLTFLVAILALVLKTTSQISQNFLDFTDYEYAISHHRIMELYNNSDEAKFSSKRVILTNNEKKYSVEIVCRGKNVFYKTKYGKGGTFSGVSILLKDVKSYSTNFENGSLTIKIVDRENKKRILKLKEKKKEDKETSDKKEDKDNENKDKS